MMSARAGACASRGLSTRRVLQSKLSSQGVSRVAFVHSGQRALWHQCHSSQADLWRDKHTGPILQNRVLHSSSSQIASESGTTVASSCSSSSSSSRIRGRSRSTEGSSSLLKSTSTALRGVGKIAGNDHTKRPGCGSVAGFATAPKRSSSKISPTQTGLHRATQRAKKVLRRVMDTCKRWSLTTAKLIGAFVRNPVIVKEWYEDIRDIVVHFVRWVMTGFRLFGVDVRASFLITKRVVHGYPLTVRERRLLVRTTSDCVKLVPFSFFIVIPFAELALPIFLRFFPGMLPSTFFQQKFDNATLARKLKAKEEMAEFWQQVVLERTKEISESDDHKYADKAVELQDFQEKLVEGAEFPTLKEILRFSRLFQEELSVQNMSKQQLSAMSRMCGLPQANSWWPGHLEVQLRHHITNLRREDRDYLWEGIDGLTRKELIDACRKRAIRFHETTDEDMRHDLIRWLELSANHKELPTSLLLWIQSFYLREAESVADETVTELQMPAEVGSSVHTDPEPDEIFLGMAERQKANVETAKRKLEELKHEIEEVLAEEETQDSKGVVREEGEERVVEESSHTAFAFDDVQEEKKNLQRKMREQEEALHRYQEVVARQKNLIDHQLGFLVSMRDNKPTKHKDVDVVLLDQQIRIMEMISDFKRGAEDIEKVLAQTDSHEKKEPYAVQEKVDPVRERRYRTRIGEHIAGGTSHHEAMPR